MEIYIASDHAGYELKQTIIAHLNKDVTIIDLGTNDAETSVDYPDFGFAVARKVVANNAYGIVVCGSGIGISIAANRIAGARAALCTTPEMARLAREHNDANILAIGARLTNIEVALACVDEFLSTKFASGRHKIRVEKLG